MAEENSRILAGRYEVGALLGRGGMAEVHLGRDTRLNRTVAIKVLRSDLARDPSFQTRFRREAQSAAALNHPAIVSVYDTGEDVSVDVHGVEHRTPFIVMEYVEGHTVRELISEGEALPLAEAVEVTKGVLAALEYSHRAGIVHRDIKPGNVMITPTGAIKVMDFGIARAMADSAATMTQTHAVVGTAQYLSPEQARGEVVDARSDLYSTGCLLYELLTGRPPFVGDSAVAVAYQHVGEPAAPPSSIAPDIPESLDRIVLKALAKNREDRYDSAASFRADLEAASRNEAISAPPIAAVGTPADQATTQLLSAQQAAAGAAGLAAGAALAGASPAAAASPTTALPVTDAADGSDLFDEFPEPEPVEEETKKSRKGLIWVLSILGVLLLGGIVYALMNQDDEPPNPVLVAVPDLAGMSYIDARDALQEVGLGINQNDETAPSDTIAKDLVVSWDPEGEVEEGTIVTVTLSSGPAAVTVPDLVDKTVEDAQQIIEKFNADNDASLTLTVAEERVPSDDIDEGRIVKYSPTGSVAVDAEIEVVVSSGPADGTIPNVTGQTEADARDLLKLAGFENIKVVSGNYPGRALGIVDRTEPGASESVSIDTEIILHVGTGSVDIDSSQILGQSVEIARDYLRSLGFTSIELTEQTSPNEPYGTVVDYEPSGVNQVAYDQGFTLITNIPPASPEPDPTSEEPTGEEPGTHNEGGGNEGRGNEGGGNEGGNEGGE